MSLKRDNSERHILKNILADSRGVASEKATVTKVRAQIGKKLSEIDRILADDINLEIKMKELVDSILKCDLLQWVPGKEIKQAGESWFYIR